MDSPRNPRLYALDFTDVVQRYVKAEVLERMTMDKNIPPTWAMMLLWSEWPPQRVRHRAMEIIAASLPPRIAGVAAHLALEDLAARRQQPPEQLLPAELLPDGVFFAVHERVMECTRWLTARAAAVWLWNHRLRHLDPRVVANARQRQRCIRDAFAGESNLDRRLVDHMVVALAAEVTAVVERAPGLAGMPVEVPRGQVLAGPDWELDERGHAQAGLFFTEWANEGAATLIRKVYKHVRPNLLDWAFRTPRLKAAREAAKVYHGEIAVTAQRCQPPRARPGAAPEHTPAAVAEVRSLLNALSGPLRHGNARC